MGCSTSVDVVHGQQEIDRVLAEAAMPDAKFRACPKYRLEEVLGQGAFGVVRASISETTKKARAVKVLDVRKPDGPGGLDLKKLAEAEQEAEVWSQVRRHPHVVELLRHYLDGSSFCLAMERCAGGSLAQLRSAVRGYTEPQAATLFREMLLGLEHVHACQVVHRDLKPGNFLLGGPEGKTVKLADFGFAAVVPARGHLSGVFGTPPYMSPEMAGGRGHNQSTDVWSLGAVCYTLFLGEYPYCQVPGAKSKSDGFKKAIVAGTWQPTFRRAAQGGAREPAAGPSDSVVQFLRRLLDRNSATRISAEAALELSFLTDRQDGARDGPHSTHV